MTDFFVFGFEVLHLLPQLRILFLYLLLLALQDPLPLLQRHPSLDLLLQLNSLRGYRGLASEGIELSLEFGALIEGFSGSRLGGLTVLLHTQTLSLGH